MASYIKVNLDTSKENYLLEKCKQNDDILLEGLIFENGLKKDLTGASISINVLKPDGTFTKRNVDAINISGNKLSCQFKKEEISAIPGKCKIDITISQNTFQNSTFEFDLLVKKLVTDGAVTSTNAVPIIAELDTRIAEAGKIKADTEQLIKTGGAATTGDIQQINTKLDHNTKRTLNMLNVLEFGFKDDGVFDNLALFNNLKLQYPNSIFYFPYNSQGIYLFSGTRPNLAGVKIKTDVGVTFKLDVNPNLKEMKLMNDVIFNNTTHNTTLTKPQNINISPLFNVGMCDTSNNEEYIKLDMTTFENKIFNTATSDLTMTGTATKTTSSITWTAPFTNNPQVIKPQTINNGSCYELSCKATNTIVYGFLIETVEGNTVHVTNQTGKNIWNIKYRYKSTPLNPKPDTSITMPNGGAYGQVLNNDTILGFYMDENKSVKLLINDYTILSYKNLIGNVKNVYFLLNKDQNTTSCTFKDAIEIKNYKYKNSKPLKLCLVGDSISYGAWNTIDPKLILKLMAQNINGVGHVEVDNISVSGRNSTDWVNDINNHNFSTYDYVLCMIGTNDIQASTNITTYTNNLNTIAQKIINDKSIPIFQIPPIFTSTTQSGVTGVTTNHYGNHSNYAHALKMFCINNSYHFGNARRNFGSNLKWYGDNIHPTEEGQIAIIKSWCEVLSRVLNS